MKEIWKDIKDYEGIYQISNLGNIKSLDRPKRNYDINTGMFTLVTIRGKIRKPRLTSFGYYTILLSKNGKRKWQVCNTFGEENNRNGYFIMSDDFFNSSVFMFAINKKYLQL